jgi:hypothetical protein
MKKLILFLSLTALGSLAVCAGAWEVLVVDAAAEPGLEFQQLSNNVKVVQGEEVNYAQVVTTGLEKEISEKYDVIWLGWNCTSDDGAYQRAGDANAIADYVESGGVLVTSATDNAGWNSDWLPAAVTVLDTGDYDLEITDEGQKLFSEPNDVGPGDPVMDERYSAIDEAWTILGWGAGMEGSEAGAMQIALGKGLYLMVSIDTRNAGNTQLALPLMENMLNYAISYIQENVAVEATGKLAATWASIKDQR